MNEIVIERLEKLGEGSHGEVFRARQVGPHGLSRDVAVKVLREVTDPALALELRRRLGDEARMMSCLRHPAVVKVERIIELDGRLAMVMEYVPGRDLVGLLAAGAIPEAQALRVVAEIADALARAWDAPGPNGEPLRLVHRDIKPGNIRLTREGQVKLMDFGVARGEFDEREAMTVLHVAVGTLGYMSPQHLMGETGPEGDVYALGVVLAEMLIGRPLRSITATGARSCTSKEGHDAALADVMKALATVSLDTRRLVRWCMDYEPTGRPTADRLSLVAGHLAASMDPEPLSRWARRLATWPAPATGPQQKPATSDEEVRTRSLPPPPPAPPARARKRRGLALLVSVSLAASLAVPIAGLHLIAPAATSGLPAAHVEPIEIDVQVHNPYDLCVMAFLEGEALSAEPDGRYRTAAVAGGGVQLDLLSCPSCASTPDETCGLTVLDEEALSWGPVEVMIPRPPSREVVVDAPGLVECTRTLFVNGVEQLNAFDGGGVRLGPGTHEVELQARGCNETRSWIREVRVSWSEGPVIIDFTDAFCGPSCARPASPATRGLVTRGAFRRWLQGGPFAERVVHGSSDEPVTDVPWWMADEYCLGWGGLAQWEDPPHTWSSARSPQWELRVQDGEPVLRDHAGRATFVDELYQSVDAGFRCVR